MKIFIVLSLIYFIQFTNSKKSCSNYDENECVNNKDECYLSKVSSCCGKDYFECLQIPHKYCSPQDSPLNLQLNKLSIKDDNLLDEKQIINQSWEWCLKKKNSILKFNSSCVPESNSHDSYFKPNKYKCKFTKCLKGFKCVDNDHNEFHKKCDSISNPCCSYQSKCIPTKDANPLDIPITKKPKGNELKELIIRSLNNENLDVKDHYENHHKKKKSNKQNEHVDVNTLNHNNNEIHSNKNHNHNKNNNKHHSSNKNHHSSNHSSNKKHHNQNINQPNYQNQNINQNQNIEKATLNPNIIYKDSKPNGQYINNDHNLNPNIIYKNHNQNTPPLDGHIQQVTNKRLLSIDEFEQVDDTEMVNEDVKNKKNHKKDKHSKNKHKKNDKNKKKKDDKHKAHTTDKPTQTPAITQPPVTETPQPPVTETPTHTPRQSNTPNPCINALCPEGSKCFSRNGKAYCRLSNTPSSLRSLKMLSNLNEYDQVSPLNCQNLPCPSDQICYMINNSPICKNKEPQQLVFYKNTCNECPKDTSSCMEREDGTSGVVCQVNPVTCGIVQCPDGKYCMDNTQDLQPNCYDKMNCTSLKAPKGYRCQSDDIRGAILIKINEPALNCANLPCSSDQVCYLDNKSIPKCKAKPQQKLEFYRDSCSNCPSGTSVCGVTSNSKEGKVLCKIVPITCGIVQCPDNQFCMDNTEDLQPNCYDKLNCSNVKAPSGYKCQPDSIRGGIFVKK